MKRILPLVLCVMPISTLAATSSEILSKGEILASATEDAYSGDGWIFYDVAYKKTIYRCYTTREDVKCYQLKDRTITFYGADD